MASLSDQLKQFLAHERERQDRKNRQINGRMRDLCRKYPERIRAPIVREEQVVSIRVSERVIRRRRVVRGNL